ncbi:MAG: acetyl-CoA carboxylase biotin carboxyl carrier protein subunit [Candidatus Aminicenantes bacterium]|jgi:biotin carboxyl carrier protein
MKYKFQVDKKVFEVEIAHNVTFHSESPVRIDGEMAKLLIGDWDENEVKSFFLDNKLYQIELVRDDQGYPTGIFVNGEYYSASLLKIDQLFYYKEKRSKLARSGIVKSFIPGNIKKIFFSLNDRVKEGDIVLIHEAMKMENEIRAPISGTIKTIGVKEGDNILAHHLLFEIS